MNILSNKTLAVVGILILLVIFIFGSFYFARNLFSPVSKPIDRAFSTTLTSSAQVLDEDLVDWNAPLAPQVVQHQPSGGEELPVNGEIIIEFDRSMNTESVGRAFTLRDPDNEQVDGRIRWQNSRIMKFLPIKALTNGTIYIATITQTAESEDGIPIEEPVELEFHTTSDLQISQVFPANKAVDVSVDSIVTVIFNHPVVPLGIAGNNMPDPVIISPTIEGLGEWINTSVYTFRPEKKWKGATTYSLLVEAGLVDASGDTSLIEDFTWQFQTLPPKVGDFQLSNGVSNPPNGFRNVVLDEYFSIGFYQSMNREKTETALSITNKSGEKVYLKTWWNVDNTLVVFTPTHRLSIGTDYLLVLSDKAVAENGGLLEKGIEWRFSTVENPSVLYTTPGEGAQQVDYSGELTIKFASPMDINSLKDKIIVTPAPKKQAEWWYNEWDWTYSSWILEPSTVYTIKILPGMSDIYGNKILNEKVIHFTTAAYNPQAWFQMPYDPVMFRVDDEKSNQDFYVAYRNVHKVEYKIYHLQAQQFISFISGIASQWEYIPLKQDLVWEYQEISQGKINELVLKKHPLTDQEGTPLAFGFYLLTLDSPDVEHGGLFLDIRLLIVADANITFKSTATETLVWLTGLNDGKPIAGVPITVYDSSYLPIGHGETDVDGLLYLPVASPIDPYAIRFVSTEGNEHFAFASSQWGSGVNMYDFGIWSSYYSPPKQPTVYLYTDRPIYRPGQLVYFKGIVRLDDDLNYEIPGINEVKITIRSFDETITEQTLSLSSFGSFSGELLLDKESALGFYTISAFFAGNELAVGEVGFNVVEYHKPEFIVDVNIKQEDVLVGSTIYATINGEYYTGGAVGEAQVEWSITSNPYEFTVEGDISRFNFTDFLEDEYIYETVPPYDDARIIAKGQGSLDANGYYSITLPTDLNLTKTSRLFEFEATITDLSGNQVSSRDSIIVHKSQIYPGIRTVSSVGTEGEKLELEAIAVEWDENPVAGQKVDIEIMERRWYSVQEQDAQGRIQWKSSVEDIPVASFSNVVLDENGLATESFIPTNGGIFRAKIKVTDDFGNLAQASTYIWVAGRDFIPWQQTSDRNLKLIADRDTYSPGDNAKILIASPFTGTVFALITVERGHISQREVIQLSSNSTIYNLPITPDMAPNIFFSVVIVKGIDESNPRPNFKVGIVKINIARSQQELIVEVVADTKEAQPGEQVTYTIITRDNQGRPVETEVSLGLSDLATLSLSEPNSKPILDHFYNYRTLNVWTSIPILLSIEDYNALISQGLAEGTLMGSGDGKGAGEFGVIQIREEFPDTAYWNPHVLTGVDGEASITVTLPDNLTTWRMDARAVSMDTRVGQTTHDLVSTKPLFVRPQTPRFFISGDIANLGAAVHNNTGQSITATITLQGEGIQLRDKAVKIVMIQAKKQVFVNWEVLVDPKADRVDLVFQAEGGEYKDASRPPLGTLDNQGIPVYRFEVRETTGTSGMMTEAGIQIETISLPSITQVQQGNLVIQVEPSLAAGMLGGLNYLEHFPYECVEQTISRFLPNILTVSAYQKAGIEKPEVMIHLDEQVKLALQRLYNWQNPDGGWGWWHEDKSEIQTSAYVVLGLVEAKKVGYSVEMTVLDKAVDYLRLNLLYKSQLRDLSLRNRQAFILYVLARAGEPDSSKAGLLFQNRQGLSLFARAYLAYVFHSIDPEDARIKVLLSDFIGEAIFSASGSHWEENEEDIWNWNTDVRSTAIILSVLSQIDPRNPLNANAARWLMSNRTSGHWRGTQETAWTLMALTEWMVNAGELNTNYQFSIALNKEQLGGGIASGETLLDVKNIVIDLIGLDDDINRLAFLRNQGEGNLYYTAQLNTFLPVEQVKPIDQGIIISRDYFTVEGNSKSISQAHIGDILQVKLTLVLPNDLHYIVVDDPLPAGLEAVDQSLKSNPQNIEPNVYGWTDLMENGWGWWHFDHVEMHDEKVTLSADYLPAGTYVYTYLVRAMTAGTFNTIPPIAQEFYFPDVYGRGEGRIFNIIP